MLDLKNSNTLQMLKEQLVQDIKVEVKNIDTDKQIKQVRVEINTNEKNLHSNIDKGVVMYNTNTKSSNKILVKRAEVFWADLGFNNQGSEQNGIRPVVIIQNDVGNVYSPTTIVAVITSKMTKAKLPVHIELPKEIYSEMPQDSVILFEQIRTLDKRRLKDKICQLDDILMHKIDKALGTSVGITIAEPKLKKELKEKTSLAKLPQQFQKYLINSFKMINTYEITIETMKINNVQIEAIDLIEDQKFREENGLMCYCDENKINYDIVFNDYKEMLKEKEEIAL